MKGIKISDYPCDNVTIYRGASQLLTVALVNEVVNKLVGDDADVLYLINKDKDVETCLFGEMKDRQKYHLFKDGCNLTEKDFPIFENYSRVVWVRPDKNIVENKNLYRKLYEHLVVENVLQLFFNKDNT